MSSGELPPTRNTTPLQRFVERHHDRFQIVKLNHEGKFPISATLYIPNSELEGVQKEKNKQWYLDSVQNAIEINQSIFQTPLPNMRYVFLSTTEEWNETLEQNKLGFKTKGDRHKAGCMYPEVQCFTPSGMESETNFLKTNYYNETAADYINGRSLPHETAHGMIDYKYGIKFANSLPKWIFEGVPMVIQHSPIRSLIAPEYKRYLVEFLREFPNDPPSEAALKAIQKTSSAPFYYDYGHQFLSWLIQRFGPTKIPDIERKRQLDTLLKNGAEGDYFDIESAFKKTYFLSYKEAYLAFRRDLMKRVI